MLTAPGSTIAHIVFSIPSPLTTRNVGIIPPLKNMVKTHISVKKRLPTIFLWLKAHPPNTVSVRLMAVPRTVYKSVLL